VLGRAGGENFKVASRVLPRATRAHLVAFYGFARLTDELGDSYPGDRLAALDWLASTLEASLSQVDRSGRKGLGEGVDHGCHPDEPEAATLVAEAARSVVSLGLDPGLLFDLIEANRWDQRRHRYASFEELLAYCRLSAVPVGRLVLGAFGCSDGRRQAWSDSICTGLQLVEHWQDVAEDARSGRVYLPGEDLERFGVDLAELERPPASERLRALMAFESWRARVTLDRGAALIGSLGGPARWAVCGFWAGGHAALDRLAAAGFDPFAGPFRPRGHRLARWSLLGLSGRHRAGDLPDDLHEPREAQ